MITACHQTRLLGDFEPYFHCACAETARILLPASNLTMPFDPACLKTDVCEIVAEQRYFKGTLRPVCTAHAQNGQNTTSGFRFDHAIRSGMVENLYSHEILAKNAILVGF